MIRNYLVIAGRSLRKYFAFSLINIAGLGLGLAVSLLLIAWVRQELSYDRFLKDSGQIYRVSFDFNFGGQLVTTALSPTALLPALEDNFPDITKGVRLYNPASYTPFILAIGDDLFEETKFYYADSTFFDLFSYHLLEGDREKALSAPYSLVLTKSVALKLFGRDNPIGRVIKINNEQDYTVTGIVDDPPGNSFLQFHVLASFSSLPASGRQVWWSSIYQTFVSIKNSKLVPDLKSKTDTLIHHSYDFGMSDPGDYVRSRFMPLTDIHLHSNLFDELEPVGDIEYVYIFSGIAALTLIIGIINYVNLSTARSTDRSKEVGIRKVIGAMRPQLFVQFIGESVMITVLAFVVGALIAFLLLPSFNAVAGSHLTYGAFMEPQFIGQMFGVLAIIACLSGIYPAILITAFKPISILRGMVRQPGKDLWLRRLLVISQFSISIILVFGTLVILNQLHYVENKRLGYDKDNLLVIPVDPSESTINDELRNEFLGTGVVESIGSASDLPTAIQNGFRLSLQGVSGKSLLTIGMWVDDNFLSTMQMEIVAGRRINESDIARVEKEKHFSFIINETAVKTLGFRNEDIIGRTANVDGRIGDIVGIVKDFHFSSLHDPIKPLVLFGQESKCNLMFVRLKSNDVARAVASLQKAFTDLIPSRPFQFSFLDQRYMNLYAPEQRMESAFMIFATLAIIIACLGLLGLVSFAISQRLKEIGVRKALGATSANIVVLITKEYALPIVIAILIGLPLGAWLMNRWLQGFAYKINIGITPVITAAVICLVVGLVTATLQALRASRIDPAKILRSD